VGVLFIVQGVLFMVEGSSSSSLLLSSLELSDTQVYEKYEPSSEPLHISVK